jgi:ferredoxin
MATRKPRVIEPQGLETLISSLRARGYRVLGPTVRDGAIVYEELETADELPVGWGDEQSPGSYRLVRRGDEARFAYAVGPHSWKQFLFPPRIRLWSARRNGGSAPLLEEESPDTTPLAFIGVRACELHAIEVQDRVFMGGRFVERDYAARREGTFVVAVNCAEPAETCFCASMDSGPRVERGYDLALTELLEGGHRLFVEVGSDRGEEILAELATRPATDADVAAAGRVVERSIGRMSRAMPSGDLRALLAGSLERARWDEVAERCLSCANCTLVCPTCFCTTVEDTTDVTGDHAERWRTWDSCFSVDHAYIHGGSVRPSGRSRYRQWLTHKLGTWHDQFGSSGCVGCGRCIAWCPVGIDITEEVAALAEEGGDDAND